MLRNGPMRPLSFPEPMSESSHGVQDRLSTRQTSPLAAPWLSVLIPVYNVEAYLRECVESVLQQLPQLQGPADRRVEVLLLNDASTDACAQLAEQLRQQWPDTIQVITHPSNQGLSAARNTLLEHAAGQYVWFLDSDDCLEPGAMAALQRVLQSDQPDVVLCDFRLWRAHEKLKHRLRCERHRHSFEIPKTLIASASAGRACSAGLVCDRAALLEGLFLSGQMHAWSKISKRILWQASAGQPALRFPVGMAFEDMATMPCLLLRAHSFVYVPEVWVAYRQRAGSILASMNRQKALDLGTALDGFARAYQHQAQAEPGLATDAVRFAIAHLAARNYVGALRALARSPAEGTAQAQAGLAQSFLNNSPLTAAQLLQQYLQRGWWARYWRARTALRGLPIKHHHG